MKRTLKTRCLTVLTACMMLTAAAQTTVPMTGFAEGNLISNSTFESGTKDWDIYKETGGACKLTTEDGKLALKISNVGQKNYSVQAYYDIIPLYKNAVYRLSYDISCTMPRYVEGMIQQNGGTYQSYVWDGLDLTTEMQTVEHEFTMKYDTDIMAKLVFNCGNQEKDGGSLPEHTIYIDNVKLELIDDSNVDYDSSKPYQPKILTDQVGYRLDDVKKAVVRKDAGTTEFQVVNAETDEAVYTGTLSAAIANSSADETDYVADFSEFKTPGRYYITCGNLDKSYEFVIDENPYGKLLDESVRMLYLQRCGCELDEGKFSHKACHASLATVYGTATKIDVSGGWHDAGDYGRYVVPGAKAVADLLYAYQANPELYSDNIGIPESGNSIPDVLDEARYELEWMMKMQADNGGVYHKVTCATFPGYVAADKETAELIVTPITTTATADFAASMAMAYEFYKPYDNGFANSCLIAAESAWAFLEQNPNLIYENPSDISTGDYGDKSDKDERYWAACQLYRATKDDKYAQAVAAMTAKDGLDWATVGDYGNIAILTMDGIDKSSALYQNAESEILSGAKTALRNTEASPYGSPITKYNWGSNMTIANAGIVLGLAYQLTGDASYLGAAEQNLHYLLGCNPLGTCFVTGFGTVSPENPHHRPSMAAGEAMPGMLVGGVNSSLEDSAAKAYCKTEPAAKCYIDNSESYSTNEITIYWNSPLTYLLTLTGTTAAPAPVGLRGDVNKDGVFDGKDVIELQAYLLGKSDTLAHAKSADFNGDDKLTALDLSMMKAALLK